MDRRVKWQQAKKAQGLCIICGKRKLKTTIMCRKCNENHNVRRRVKIVFDSASDSV